MRLRWFLSGSVRQATEMAKQVRKQLDAQRDILSPQAIEGLTAAIRQTNEVLDSGADNEALEKAMENLDQAAGKWLKRYPHPEWRENIEVLLVAIAVAMAIRTFFLQPFKIPTGSMQPTLFGVTVQNELGDSGFKMPSFPKRFFDACVGGRFYHQLIAADDGQVVDVPPVRHPLKGVPVLEYLCRFVNVQDIPVEYKDGRRANETIWFAPDQDPNRPPALTVRTPFRKGESIVQAVETTGDHLFVDRVTYNFRRPQRGEIIVFKTLGIGGLPQDQFYIKRLVGLPNERISIGEDRHVRINGQRLDATTPHFENVYSFNPGDLPRDSHYSGHVPQWRFADNAEFNVSADHLLVFGDNTVNSWDSRGWGELSENNVIGRSCFVYWPISTRFGWCTMYQ